MSLVKTMFNSLFKRNEPLLSRKQIRQAKPIRNPLIEWEADNEGKIILTVPRKKTRFWSWLGGFLKAPDFHIVELELVGATVWRNCDGITTVEMITKELCQQYKMNRVEAELSLNQFLQTLVKRGYIAFLVNKK